MNFFQWGHPEGYVFAVPTRSIEDLMIRLQAAVTMVNANMLRHVPRECHVGHCHLSSNGQRPLQTPIVSMK
jgi:hypothetical protein